MKKVFVLLAFCAAALISAVAQGPSGNQAVDNDFVHQQFGKDFTLVAEVPPWLAIWMATGLKTS